MLGKNVSQFRDRHGKIRTRFRKAGLPTHYAKNPVGTPEFEAELRAWRTGQTLSPGAGKIKPGTVADLVSRYYCSTDFNSGKPVTIAKKRAQFEAFRSAYGERTVKGLTFEAIDRILATKAARHPFAARNLRKQLRRLFAYAVKIGMIERNPVEFSEPVKARSEGFHAWTEDEIARYQSVHPAGTMARLALELMLWTGKRRSDVVALGPQHVKNGFIESRDEKTGKWAAIPIAPPLLEAMMAMPPADNLTFIYNTYGRPFTAKSFGNRMRKWCDEAGLSRCACHGLRKAISRRMAHAGAGNPGIKSITLHSGDSEVSRYTASVEQRRLAIDTMEKLANAYQPVSQSDMINGGKSKAGEG